MGLLIPLLFFRLLIVCGVWCVSINGKQFNIISEAHAHYENLIGDPIVYVYKTKTNSYRMLSVSYSATNFMHLCGVSYKPRQGVSGPRGFYDAIKNHKLRLDDVKLKSDGTTDQKLLVLRDISHLDSCGLSIVDDAIFLDRSNFDKSIKRRNHLLVGLKFVDSGYVPISVYNWRRKNIKLTHCDVVGVFRGVVSEATIIDIKPDFNMKKAKKLIV